MANETRDEREDAFRADVARLIQVLHHHLPAADASAAEPAGTNGRGAEAEDANGTSADLADSAEVAEIAALRQSVRHLAALLDEDAPTSQLLDAAISVVDVYEWPSPEASSSGEGAVIDPSILGTIERLRSAADELDREDPPDAPLPPDRHEPPDGH
ncbi:MAG TPA: hypothetical protein VMV92_03565 [Streptosporangiaceae bacterium]|nr:hypothetical protein [Streptosporangiaceae bacterium]